MTEIRVKRLGVMDKRLFPKHIRHRALQKWQKMTEEAKIIPKSIFFLWGGIKTLTSTKDDAQNPL